MNVNDLFEDNYHGNGNPTYYIDKECKILFSGNIEKYHNGAIEEISEVINGVKNGLVKLYENGILNEVIEAINNVYWGWGIEYYPNGYIKSITYWYLDQMIFYCVYSEERKVITKRETEIDNILDYDFNLINFERIKADFDKMNEEILTYGHPLNLPKGFEFVKLDE